MSESLQRVAFGLKLIHYGYVVILIDVMIGLHGSCLVGLAQAATNTSVVLLAIIVGLYLIGAFLVFVGRVCCLSVPVAYGRAKPFLLIAIAIDVFSLLLSGLAIYLEFEMRLMHFGLVLHGLWLFFRFNSWMLFVLFCRALATFTQQVDAHRKANSILGLVIAALTIGLVGGTCVYILSGLQIEAFGPIVLASVGGVCALFAGLMLVAIFRYLSLIWLLGEGTKSFAMQDMADELDDADPRLE